MGTPFSKRWLFDSRKSPSETSYEPLRTGHTEKPVGTCDYSAPRAVVPTWFAAFAIGVLCGVVCTWLLFVSSAIFGNVGGFASDPLDSVFGKIPMRLVEWQNSTALMDSDPFDGAYWTQDENSVPSPWDEISRGSWIQLAHSPKLGIFGGLPLANYTTPDRPWPPEMQGFVPSMWHDMHCIGTMKHVIMELHKNPASTLAHSDYMHSTHCLERWRLATMCHGDLTLGRPAENGTKIDVTGWGTMHYCKDWSVLKEKLASLSISFTEGLKVYDNTPGSTDAPEE